MSLEIFGDAWTLLVLRDMMFGGKRNFRELPRSDERISSNILVLGPSLAPLHDPAGHRPVRGAEVA